MNRTEGRRTTRLHRSADAVFAAALNLVEGADYQVLDLRQSEREVAFTRTTTTSVVEWTYEVSVKELADGAKLEVLSWHLSPTVPSRDDRREARKRAETVLDEFSAEAERSKPTDAEEEQLGLRLGLPRKNFLADLTGRRAWLATLVLLGAYLAPVAVAWGIVQAARADLFGDSTWLGPVLVCVIGLGLVVALTIRFGAWIQAVSFGEEYMLSFRPVPGFFLGWWRFIVQLGAFIVVIFISADAEGQVTSAKISNAETAALSDYVERAPIPEGWEFFSDSMTQNEYDDRPNATVSLDYIVPIPFGVTDIEVWFQDPGWAAGVDGMPPFGALRNVECDAEFVKCEAEVTPPTGEPVEYFVDARFDDGYSVKEDGEAVPAGLLLVEVEYEEHDSR